MNPGIKIENIDDTFINFSLDNCDLSLANTFRRIALAEIPTMAIEFVTVFENTTCMNDEFIVHRLGLLPLISSNVDTFNFPNECPCNTNEEVCPNCSVKFKLDVKNLSNEVIEVTTRDLDLMNCENDNQKRVRFVEYSEKSGVRPIVIMKLDKNQNLRLEAIAKKGIGKTHSKWAPICAGAFKRQPIISLNNDILKKKKLEIDFDNNKELELKEKFINICPKKVFSLNKNTKEIEIENENNCIFCGECEKFADENNLDKFIKVEEGNFKFELESIGSLKPDEVLDGIFSQLWNKLEKLSNGLKDFKIFVNKIN